MTVYLLTSKVNCTVHRVDLRKIEQIQGLFVTYQISYDGYLQSWWNGKGIAVSVSIVVILVEFDKCTVRMI